jgi:Cytochrome c/c1 heme lyase
MDTVVSVHNTMNEKTWQQIQMWENIDGVDPGDGTGMHSSNNIIVQSVQMHIVVAVLA